MVFLAEESHVKNTTKKGKTIISKISIIIGIISEFALSSERFLEKLIKKKFIT